MKLSDEVLKAYYDGELDLVARAEVAAAIDRDPGIARIAEEYLSLRAPVRAAPRSAAAAEPEPMAALPVAATLRPDLPLWALPLAALALGLMAGKFMLGDSDAPYAESESGLVARDGLAWALSGQLAGDTGTGMVRIGSSFRDRSGAYCRTFRLHHEAPFAGLACRLGADWQIPLLIAAPPGEIGPHEITAMPMAVLRAVDAVMDGEPLDAAAEAAARDADWQP